ncbi:MAG: DNA recombination protein RmuC, partial [Proteobacteria bacterium]
MQSALSRIESSLKDEFRNNRQELNDNMRHSREEVNSSLITLMNQNKEDSRHAREAIANAFKDFKDTFDNSIRSFNDLQREKFSQMDAKQAEMVRATEQKLESIRITVEEKLEKTLSDRLGQSFETVGKQLIEVQKGLGEMQTLAQDVGGLKRVLSNVKM